MFRQLMQHAKPSPHSVQQMEPDALRLEHVLHTQPNLFVQVHDYLIFLGNVASSGAKSCNWTANGASGTCSDKGCSDAPTTYNS